MRQGGDGHQDAAPPVMGIPSLEPITPVRFPATEGGP